jgi:hypothetical protein
VTSLASKFADDSLNVNVSVAVWPLTSVGVLLEIATVGATVSIAIAGVSAPAVLALPAASVNVPAATLTVPLPVKFVAGVNVAV